MRPLHTIYLLLRPVLGLLCFILWRKLRYLYFAVSFISLILPADLGSGTWWSYVFAPIATTRLLLAIGCSVSLFYRTTGWLRDRERNAVLGFGASLGLALSLAGWSWNARTSFEAFTTLRQYAYIALTVLTVCSWLWVRWLRPVPSGVPPMYLCWCVWLCAAAFMASAGRGGLCWLVVEWSGSANVWDAIGVSGFMAQALVALALLRSLHPRDPQADYAHV